MDDLQKQREKYICGQKLLLKEMFSIHVYSLILIYWGCGLQV
jgi:hypothetical protein